MTESTLCERDDQAAFDFLARAVPVLRSAGIQPATLSLLDSINAYPTGYGDIAGRTPGLPELAAEWAGPYQSQAYDGIGPTTVRALVIAALGADEAGNYDIGFRTYAVEETEHWNLTGTPLAGVPVFGLYLIKEGERTHVCSFTPSSWAVNLENVFCYPDQSDEPSVNEYGQSAIDAYIDRENPEHEGLDDTYLGYLGDRAELDRREREEGDVSARIAFDISVLGVDLHKIDEHAASPVSSREDNALADFATLQATFYKAASEEAWEEAREYNTQGNSIQPDIILKAA